MYGNLLTPSRLFGMAVCLLATAGVLVWAGRLTDIETPAFDAGGWALLGSAAGTLLLGLLFLRRAKWVRLPASILLHVLALGLLAALAFVCLGESAMPKTLLVSLALVGVGLSVVGILVLRSDAMKNDLARGPASPLMKPMHALVAGACLLSFAGVGAWQLLPLVLAKPTISVDYVAWVNRGRKPTNYDASRNAAPHYEKFFSEFTPLPPVLKDKWESWPVDLNPEECRALEEWAPVNEPVLTALAQAAPCPYWWYELKSSDGSIAGLQTSDLEHVTDCAKGALLLCKYKASRGDTDGALRLLTDLHMLGIYVRVGTLMEQMRGLAICNAAGDALLAILAHDDAGPDTLRRTLDTLVPRVALIRVPRFSGVEYADGRDRIQRAFTNDGFGSGNLIPRRLYEYKKEHAGLYDTPIPYLDAVRIALTHPRRQETTLLFEEFFTAAGRLAQQTPWELHTQNTSHEERVASLLSPNYFLKESFVSIGRCIRMSWRARVFGEGTVLVLAVFTYRAQEGRLPEALSQLVDARLLPRVPLDPYSGQPYVYRVTGDRFTLYSVGEDFRDDGGVPGDWDGATGDRVFWPVAVPAQTQTGTPPRNEHLAGAE